MARSPVFSCGTRCRAMTSSSCPQERFTRLARVSSLQNSNSWSDTTFRLFDHGRERELHSRRHHGGGCCGTADFQVRQSQLTAERRLLVSNLHFGFRTDRSDRHLGICKRNERLGFSLSAAALPLDRSSLPPAIPCSRNRTVSTFTPAPPAWWASWRTRAAARSRSYCNVSHDQAQSMSDGQGDTGAHFLPSKGCTEEWPPGNN